MTSCAVSQAIASVAGRGYRSSERFSALLRGTDGLSQRMLTRTLRLLERDGLVERDVAPTRPPQVTYSLTVLGRSLAQAIDPLTAWAVGHRAEIADARRAYDHSDAAAAPT